MLNIVADELGVKKYIEVAAPTTDPSGETRTVTIENPAYWTTGEDGRLEFNEKRYERDLEAAATEAPALYSEIVSQLRHEGYEIPMQGKSGIIPDDFLYHTRSKHPELDAWREQREADRASWFEMEAGPEKEARADELRRLYGGDFLHFEERQAFVSTNEYTTRENYIYNSIADVLSDYYTTLRPSQKRALQEEFPLAFEDATGTNEEGETYDFKRLVPLNLTSEQMDDLQERFNLKIGQRQSDRESGSDDRRTVGVLAREADNERIQTNQDLGAAHSVWIERPFLTPEQLQADNTWRAHLEEQGDALTTWGEQDESFEDAAQIAYADPRTFTRQGFTSWSNTARLVGEDSPLGQYILARKALSDAAGEAGVFDAKETWFTEQPDHIRQALIEEYPDSFTRYADLEGATASDGTPATDNDPTPVGSRSGTPGWIDSGRGTGTPDATTRTSRPSQPSQYGSAPRPAAAESSIPAVVFGLDPILVAGSGAEFNERQAEAAKVAQGMTGILRLLLRGQRRGLFGTTDFDAIAGVLQMQLLRWLTRHLGPNPTLDQWRAASARLTAWQATNPTPTEPMTPEPPPTVPTLPASATAVMAY